MPADAAAQPLSSLAALVEAQRRGEIDAAHAVQSFETAIAADNRQGAGLRAVIALNPKAEADARALDEARRSGRAPRPLHGAPILIKDNIETGDGLPTTAGSLALSDNRNNREAPLVSRLRSAGAVILGKANLSEWANYRGSASISGWSAVGGQTRNAIDPSRTPCGSSAGSAVAVAAGFAAAAIGTETDGSITCPAAVNGLVGVKPTVGLIPRTFIVPISHSQDTPGPITRTVKDAALLLTAMAGSDANDPATAAADMHRTDFAQGLDQASASGLRLGVMRFAAGFDPATDAVFEAALSRLRAAGVELVEITEGPDHKALSAAESLVLRTEFKSDLNAYLSSTDPDRVATRTLGDLITFNIAHADAELALFGQELFEAAQASAGLDDPDYRAALARGQRMAGADGIDRMLVDYRVEALIAPTLAPAWRLEAKKGDEYRGGAAGQLAAVAGYPHLTVPMGRVQGLPVGLSILGPAWSEARLLRIGAAFERLRPAP